MAWVGLDDTDAPDGGCTTYVAVRLMRELERAGAEVVGRPFLVRLNPNVPFKTRGNAAVAFRVEGEVDVREVVERVLEGTVGEHPETRPGVVVYPGRRPPGACEVVYKRAVRGLIGPAEVRELVGERVEVVRDGRGVVGAVAALGFARLRGREVTFEGIAYRDRGFWGSERRVVKDSVWELDERTFPVTFDNVDRLHGEVLITPHTPCPVLYGVRAVEAWVLEEVVPRVVRAREPVVDYVVFETNQGTDAHLRTVGSLSEASDYESVVVEVRVEGEPRRIRGGHVVVPCEDEEGNRVDLAAFAPARPLTEVVEALRPGDVVRVAGAVRPETPKHPRTINVEKLLPVELVREERSVPPVCGRCGGRMASAGRGKGFKCKRCGERAPEGSEVRVEVPRELVEGRVYEAPPVARRHLSKPEYLVDLGLLEPSPIREGG